VQLAGGGCRCSGMLEVSWDGAWRRVCQGDVGKASLEGICRHLGCGPPNPEPIRFLGGKEPRAQPLRCQRSVAEPLRCRWVPANCSDHLVLTCQEPVKTSPEPTPPAPATAPEPTGPARLLLVDGALGCSGFVELHMRGTWGAVASSPAIGPLLATRICRAVRCGTAIPGHGELGRASHGPVRWEVVEPCEDLLDCFNRTQRGGAPAFLTCSGSRARQRLAGGPTPCEGDVEIFHEGRWKVLCDNRARRDEWGRQLCQELRCGNLSSSSESRDPPSLGVTCRVPTLRLLSQGSHPMPPALSAGQDSKPHPAGTSAGTIASICLALLLLGILALLCGPPAYRRVMKRISKKKQRQWIGPTGLNQT
ncbi:CD5 protein, partial [Centropus bengalensis]|nr:CD5 protein [Centropus bengalensis]